HCLDPRIYCFKKSSMDGRMGYRHFSAILVSDWNGGYFCQPWKVSSGQISVPFCCHVRRPHTRAAWCLVFIPCLSRVHEHISTSCTCKWFLQIIQVLLVLIPALASLIHQYPDQLLQPIHNHLSTLSCQLSSVMPFSHREL